MSDNGFKNGNDQEVHDVYLPIDADLWESGGEFVWLPETLVVSPAPGRFRRAALSEGATIAIGAVIGHLSFNGGAALPVASPVGGVFLGWLAWEGEGLQRGTPLARIDPSRNGLHSDDDSAANGSEPSVPERRKRVE